MTGARRRFAMAAVVALSACAIARPLPPRAIVLITLDTTRADRLPTYGYASASTPALDRLAREGVVFDHAATVAPLTLTAHTSVFTGLYPTRHGVRDNADRPLGDTRATLATILRGHGFRTAAFVGSAVLASDRGLARGFDVYDDGRTVGGAVPRRRSGDQVVDAAVKWLDGVGSSPFLLWVHLYDAHSPQSLPDEYRRAYGDEYEGGIAYEDTQIGRVIDALDRKRLLPTTAVIVAGDHGESLGEHGEQEHGIFLYDSVLHVPLMIRAPGLPRGRVTGLVSLVDVLPTVLDLLRFARIETDGASLQCALLGGPVPDRRGVYAESMYARRFGWSPLRAVVDGRYKYIDAPRPELYDLETDPFEQHDLSAERRTTADAMRRELQRASHTAADAADTNTAVTPEVQARLAALGYAGGAPAPSDSAGRDPKDFIGAYNAARSHRVR